MRIDRLSTDALTLRLSRRNLEALLHMLDDPNRPRPALIIRHNGIEVLVVPQEDEDHYVEQKPGQMSWERGGNT